MKDWDELLEEDEEGGVGGKIVRFGIKHGAIIVAIIAVLIVIALVGSLRSAHAEIKELKEANDLLNDAYNYRRDKQDELDSSQQKTIPIITSALIEEELGALADLVTQEYIYTNSAKAEQGKEWIFGWEQPFGEKSLLVTYDGTIKAGIDLGKATVEVDDEHKIIEVVLPQSRITDNIIPEENVDIVYSKDGLFNEVTHDDYLTLIEREKPKMEQKAIDRGLLEKADKEARSIVKGFLSNLSEAGGYKLNVSTVD